MLINRFHALLALVAIGGVSSCAATAPFCRRRHCGCCGRWRLRLIKFRGMRACCQSGRVFASSLEHSKEGWLETPWTIRYVLLYTLANHIVPLRTLNAKRKTL
jgi:hypothetical protein